MNQTTGRPTFTEALAWAFQRLGEEWRGVLLLSVLLVAAMLVALSPLMGCYIELFKMVGAGGVDPAALEPGNFPFARFFLAGVLAMAGSSVIYVLLSRLSDLDGAQLLASGFGALWRRALWVVWRLICGIGWMFLAGAVMGLAVTLVLIVVAVPAAMVMDRDSAAVVTTLFAVPLYLVMLVVFVGIYGALSISIYAAARDLKIGILATWNALKGARRSLILANVLLYLIFALVYVVTGFLAGIFTMAAGPGFAVVLFMSLAALASGIYGYLWLTLGAAYAGYALDRS